MEERFDIISVPIIPLARYRPCQRSSAPNGAVMLGEIPHRPTGVGGTMGDRRTKGPYFPGTQVPKNLNSDEGDN